MKQCKEKLYVYKATLRQTYRQTLSMLAELYFEAILNPEPRAELQQAHCQAMKRRPTSSTSLSPSFLRPAPSWSRRSPYQEQLREKLAVEDLTKGMTEPSEAHLFACQVLRHAMTLVKGTDDRSRLQSLRHILHYASMLAGEKTNEQAELDLEKWMEEESLWEEERKWEEQQRQKEEESRKDPLDKDMGSDPSMERWIHAEGIAKTLPILVNTPFPSTLIDDARRCWVFEGRDYVLTEPALHRYVRYFFTNYKGLWMRMSRHELADDILPIFRERVDTIVYLELFRWEQQQQREMAFRVGRERPVTPDRG